MVSEIHKTLYPEELAATTGHDLILVELAHLTLPKLYLMSPTLGQTMEMVERNQVEDLQRFLMLLYLMKKMNLSTTRAKMKMETKSRNFERSERGSTPMLKGKKDPKNKISGILLKS
jgi:hypothetical protein